MPLLFTIYDLYIFYFSWWVRWRQEPFPTTGWRMLFETVLRLYLLNEVEVACSHSFVVYLNLYLLSVLRHFFGVSFYTIPVTLPTNGNTKCRKLLFVYLWTRDFGWYKNWWVFIIIIHGFYKTVNITKIFNRISILSPPPQKILMKISIDSLWLLAV